MKLLQGNQLLEEVSVKRSKEERRLGKMRAEKLQVAHTQFATVGTIVWYFKECTA